MDTPVTGSAKRFVDGGHLKRSQWIHTVILKDLKYNTRYVYHCGSEYGWSEKFSFKTPPAGEDWIMRVGVLGDLGNTNAHALSYLQDEAENDHFDMMIHVGDFAYNLHDHNGLVGDQFMRQIQPMAAIVPYMVCPGNHESTYNFSNYVARFAMPGPYSNHYYSFDIGPVHFISINTEFYYSLGYGTDQLLNQFDWVVRDLVEATKPENRNLRPWIIMYGHRPMYCANKQDECYNIYHPTRVGVKNYGCGLEPLLKKYGVDLMINGHKHSYERLWPIYDLKVYNGSYDEPYTNPKAPVHIVTGSAGCDEGTYLFQDTPPSWSAFRSSDYSYSRLTVYNKSHIYLDQVDVTKRGKVIDDMWLIKHKHEAYHHLP